MLNSRDWCDINIYCGIAPKELQAAVEIHKQWFIGMCGICGELRFDASIPELAVIERMKERLQERGPDSEGAYT